MWMSLSLFHGGCHFPANRQEVREIRTGRNSFCIEINGICTGLGMPAKSCFNLTCIFIFYLICQKNNLSCLVEEQTSFFSPCSFTSTDFQITVCSQTAAWLSYIDTQKTTASPRPVEPVAELPHAGYKTDLPLLLYPELLYPGAGGEAIHQCNNPMEKIQSAIC